jgi:hypothetical protein
MILCFKFVANIQKIFFQKILKFLSGVLKNVVILQPEKGSKCCLIYQ